MKELFKNRKLLIIIVVVLILILLSIMFFFLLSPGNKNTHTNKYKFSKSIKELPGTQTYQNDKLKKAHCVDNVCIENVVFYYKGNDGRVEYTIMNRNNHEVSDTLRMVFGDKSLLVVYNKLGAKKKINATSRYVGVEIKNKEDYKLQKLSKEEKEKIIKK